MANHHLVPQTDLPPDLLEKYRALQNILRPLGRVAIACSGGVDSTLLLRVAADTLAEKPLAVLAVSVLQPPSEIEYARQVIAESSCFLVEHHVDPFILPEFLANPPDRCYHCKTYIYQAFFQTIRARGLTALLDGTNASDLGEDRPGLRALAELQVITPLADAGLHKNEVRRLSRHLGLTTWDHQSNSCLATRIPHGHTITRELVQAAADCEQHLHTLGFQGCRVRMYPDSAHVELVSGDHERFVNPAIIDSFKQFALIYGNRKVFLDLSEREGIVC